MQKENLELVECPVKKSLEIIGGKWKLRIIFQIGSEVRRYGDLKRLIPDISEKMLIQELKSLVEYGVLSKKSFNEIPPRVEYTLTEKGKEVLPIIDMMIKLGTTEQKAKNKIS
jgi:DNA-binding HxlR family transcriptional regulator